MKTQVSSSLAVGHPDLTNRSLTSEERYLLVLQCIARFELRRRRLIDPVYLSYTWAFPPLDFARALDALVAAEQVTVIGTRTVRMARSHGSDYEGTWKVYQQAPAWVIYDDVLGVVTMQSVKAAIAC